MEKDKKINQINSAGERHGYWEKYIGDSRERIWYRIHYVKGNAMGYDETRALYKEDIFNCHYISGYKIGCSEHRRSQHFYKTPDKKFGEEIRWK